MKNNPYRLGNGIRPVLYDLQLEPDLDKFTFDGFETVHLDVLKPVSSVTLHAADLKVLSGELTALSKRSFRAKKISYDEKMETVTLHFGEKVKPGKKYQL